VVSLNRRVSVSFNYFRYIKTNSYAYSIRLLIKRHSDSMINKLESAGLGYSVKTGDTNERLGELVRHGEIYY
jgi:hypothetical protein